MTELFSSDEIVQMGIRIEENGRDFYNTLEKSARSEEVKVIFHFLGEEEERHIRVFQGLLSEVENYEPKEAYPDEYFDYLTALSRDYIFTKEKTGKRIAETIENDLDAVALGIDFEKDSILFYHEMKNLVWAKGRDIIDRLIEEERRHLQKLWELKAELDKNTFN